MEWSNGIRNSHLNIYARLFSCLCSAFHITRIVTSIENTETSDTVLCSCFNKFINNVICIVLVTKKVLSTKKHHDFVVWKSSVKLAKTFPWIFVQKADTRVISSSTPTFNIFITSFIKLITDRKHICSCHTCSVKTLVSITDCKFGNSNFCHNLTS